MAGRSPNWPAPIALPIPIPATSKEASAPATFEVFTRRLPAGRRYGVLAGVGRLVEALGHFCFGEDQLAWLARQRLVSEPTLEWLAGYRFTGSIDGYAEGELYTAGSPLLTVEGSFGEAVLLETLVLSILNHDSAVAAAASLLTTAAGDRPVIEMGSRRTDPDAAVAAARAAFVGGFASTSNLEAGRLYGIPTAGTAAHAFTLVHRSEADAFAAQVAALGPGTTLLVDTFDIAGGIRHAVAAAGPSLGAIRIDSGDLTREAVRARRLLDSLGANATRIVVTGDLDDSDIEALASAPVDGYGVGTSVVTGLGAPTAGFVYKLVAAGSGPGGQQPVAKLSPGKATVGGRKWAWRAAFDALPPGAEAVTAPTEVPVLADVVAGSADAAPEGGRPLQAPLVVDGRPVAEADPASATAAARRAHLRGRGELGPERPLVLVRVSPAP